MDKVIAKKRISEVLMVDSINSSQSDFFATHVPFKKIEVKTNSGNDFIGSKRTEDEIYDEIFDNDTVDDKHQFIIVEGSSGAGKSHFIRWLNARLEIEKNENQVPILIRRNDNTLKGTIRQLLNINEVKNIANKEVYDRFVKANNTISENKFKNTIYHNFIVEIETDSSGTISSINRKKLIALLNNSMFQDKLLSVGGPIERIYNKIVSSSKNANREDVAQFEQNDIMLDIDFCDKLEEAEADKKARQFANMLLVTTDGENDFIDNMVDYLNSFVEKVIQNSAGIEPGDFQQIFKEIRQELKKQGKNLILFVEDITSFTGINQALLNALITSHKGENSVDNMCKLISIIGTTSEYYRQFRDNYRDRITKQITIHEGFVGDSKKDLIQFFAKYLNAVSLESTIFEEWIKNGINSEEFPVHNDVEHKDWGYFKISKDKKISLYPFNEESIVRFYDTMTSPKTPRYIIRDIIEPALNEVISNVAIFPKFCSGWRLGLSETTENKIINNINALDISDDDKNKYRSRLLPFIGFWGNQTIDITDDDCISGIKTSIYRELGFDDFVKHLKATNTVVKAESKSEETTLLEESMENQDSVQEQLPDTPSISDSEVKKRQEAYDKFKVNVDSWYRDKKKLINFQPIRDTICKFVYETINWQHEEVPYISKKLFEDANSNKLIGFERQDQGVDKCFILLKDSDETYQLLLCFGKWLYLGGKSWDFTKSSVAIYYATTWLERYKAKFVEIVRGAEVPAYIKSAIMVNLYTNIINGEYKNGKSNTLTVENMLMPKAKKNTSKDFIQDHSNEWYELQNFIFSSGMFEESHSAYTGYFNIVQGNIINTPNYVLNYSLIKKAVKELNELKLNISDEALSEVDNAVKTKREIYEYSTKVFSKAKIVAEKETKIATEIVENIYPFFGFDYSFSIDARDVRVLITEIKNFYEKSYNAGINLESIKEKDKDASYLKEHAEDIAKAIKSLKLEYDEADTINILMAFSDNPISIAKRFLNLLNEANQDVLKVEDQMNSEKMSMTRKGNWKENNDIRFDEKRAEFESLYTRFKEV